MKTTKQNSNGRDEMENTTKKELMDKYKDLTAEVLSTNYDGTTRRSIIKFEESELLQIKQFRYLQSEKGLDNSYKTAKKILGY
jgi:uncharacterized protein (UPF0335 family)